METGAGESASIIYVFAASLKSRGVAGSLVVDNLGDPSATSDSLRIALQSDRKMRDAVGAADIVVVSVGGNDADPFATYPPGTCSLGGRGGVPRRLRASPRSESRRDCHRDLCTARRQTDRAAIHESRLQPVRRLG